MTRLAIPVFLLVGATLLLFQFHADASSSPACSVANAQQAAQELTPGESPGQIRAVLCDDFPRYQIMIFLTRDWHAVRPGQNSQHEWADDSLGVADAKPDPGAIKILPDGDLVADSGVGYLETLRWTGGNYAHFQAVAVSPPPATSSCSLSAARELLALQGGYFLSPTPATLDDVNCHDFSRYRLMIFWSDEGGDGTKVYSVYRAVNDKWVHVQDVTVFPYQELGMLENGDFSEQGGGQHAVLHWNGTRFVTAKKWLTLSYWDGRRWVEKALEKTASVAGCSPEEARDALATVIHAAPKDVTPRELACGDFTGQGAKEFAVSIPARWGNPNYDSSYIVSQAGSRWHILFNGYNSNLHCIRPDGRGGFVGVADTLDKGMMSDPACAPDGERCEALRRYRWNGETFALVQRWHEPRSQGIGSCSNPAPEKVH